ncbi:MAG TPA: hypothetical protein VNL35_16235 [Chloroflexota bacterium]|nr:hypothetical protein [Chloroflexota bacterium]
MLIFSQLLIHKTLMVRVIQKRLRDLRERQIEVDSCLFRRKMICPHSSHELADGHIPAPQPQLTPPGVCPLLKVAI